MKITVKTSIGPTNDPCMQGLVSLIGLARYFQGLQSNAGTIGPAINIWHARIINGPAID